MRSVRAMSAQYTEVTLDDMTKYLSRGFHALHPKKSVERGEVVFDLLFSKTTGVRVWTSIGASGNSAADKGADAIRVVLFSFARNKPLKPGKAPIVKRTQNWRDSLTDRIEEAMEDFDTHEEEIERGAFVKW